MKFVQHASRIIKKRPEETEETEASELVTYRSVDIVPQTMQILADVRQIIATETVRIRRQSEKEARLSPNDSNLLKVLVQTLELTEKIEKGQDVTKLNEEQLKSLLASNNILTKKKKEK